MTKTEFCTIRNVEQCGMYVCEHKTKQSMKSAMLRDQIEIKYNTERGKKMIITIIITIIMQKGRPTNEKKSFRDSFVGLCLIAF